MEPRIIADERARALAGAAWGANLDADDAVAEVLRAEVTARGSCRRSATLAHVQRMLAAFIEISPERVADICQTLVQQGDFSLASGGVLHATPLRAVEIEAGGWRIISSLPLRYLQARLPATLLCTGTQRQLVFPTSDETDVSAAVDALRGVKMSASTWAGLELAPKADDSWLAALEEQLKWLAEPAGNLDHDGKLDWQALYISEEGTRWRRDGQAPAKLWRARTVGGYWVFAWTGSEEAPSAVPFIRLSQDDANRTVFALARSVDQALQLSVTPDGDKSIIGIRDWLPRAEYRYLSTMAQPLSRESHMDRWALPTEKEEEVLSILVERLGLERGEP